MSHDERSNDAAHAGLIGRRAVLAGAVVGTTLTGMAAANAQTPPQPDVSKPSPEGLPPANRGAALAGKVAVITGAARGIGRAIAWEMAANGADIVALDICGPVSSASNAVPATPADLQATADGVKKLGRRCDAITGDIRDIKALRAIAAKVEADHGKIDILVANAAIQRWKPLLEMDDADWMDVVDNNLNGSANTLRAFAPGMVRRKSGRIILVSSMQGKHGSKDASSYSASKWGILGLMKSAALEFGPAKVTVNALIPGLVDTALTRYEARFRASMGETDPNPPPHPSAQQAWDQRLVQVPLKVGWLQPADLGPAAVFLASDGAAMVTGAEYEVTAGDSAHDI